LDLKDSNVLVTGGAGFIGSHLADGLSKLGCSIGVFDDMSKGRLENIRSLMIKRNVKLIRTDIRQYPTVKHAVKDDEYAELC
jgi:UDP-glucose 4-epimerase